MKTVGGFRRTRYRGVGRTGLAGYFVATAYNLVRMASPVVVSVGSSCSVGVTCPGRGGCHLPLPGWRWGSHPSSPPLSTRINPWLIV